MSSKRRLRRREQRRAQVAVYRQAMRACLCGKVHGRDREDAESKYELASTRNGNRNPVRFYACHFGGWHWTSRLDDTPWRRAPKPARDPHALTPEQVAWVQELAEQEAATVPGQLVHRPAA